jgi:hypothetical protein
MRQCKNGHAAYTHDPFCAKCGLPMQEATMSKFPQDTLAQLITDTDNDTARWSEFVWDNHPHYILFNYPDDGQCMSRPYGSNFLSWYPSAVGDCVDYSLDDEAVIRITQAIQGQRDRGTLKIGEDALR